MSYEPEAHAAQMAILKHLLLVRDAAFAELQKATDLTSDHFNFHIARLLEVGYVIKNGSGRYHLTRAGKEYANRMDTDEKVMEKQAKLAVLLIIENERGEFIAQQRLKQPYYGFWGRPTGKIRWGETVLAAAARELLEETGLTASLAFKGIYHKLDYTKDGELLEDKYFYMVHGTQPRGELVTAFEGGKNAWMSEAALLAQDTVFEGIVESTAAAAKQELSFIEAKHYYDEHEY